MGTRGRSEANTRRLAGASAHPQLAMSSKKARREAIDWVAEDGATERPVAHPTGQLRVMAQLQYAST